MFYQKPGIYKITNITNNKNYIGSSINISVRITSHKNRLNRNKHANSYLQRSYNKYGFNNFIFEILEYCDENLLLNKEEYYINLYNSNNQNFGYNMCSFERGRNKLSQETKDKIRNAHKGRKRKEIRSVETRLKMSKANKGKKRTEETKRKISIAKTGVKRNITWMDKMVESRRKHRLKVYLGEEIIFENITVPQLKDFLKISDRTIYSYIKNNRLCKGYKLEKL